MYDFLDLLKGISLSMLIFFILLVIIGIPSGIISYFVEKKGCAETANKLNYNYDFSIWTGCMVIDTNNNKFLLEQLRQIKED